MRVPVTAFRGLGVAAALLVLAGCQALPNGQNTSAQIRYLNYEQTQQKNDYICRTAIQSSQPKWVRPPNFQGFVLEAKRRGLSEQQCARLANIPNWASVLQTLSSKVLCTNAVQSPRPKWDASRQFRQYVTEAKRRGLTEQQCARLSGRFTEQQIAAVQGAAVATYGARQCPGKYNASTWTNCIGTYTTPVSRNHFNRGKYIGEFKDGKFHGHGTFTYSGIRGGRYIGEFKDGKFHGHGTRILPKGYEYVGEWKNGKKSGYGTEILVTGNKYTGDFLDDKYHGQGRLRYSNGHIEEGRWKNNYFQNVKIFQPTTIAGKSPHIRKSKPPAVRPNRKPKIFAKAAPSKPKPSPRTQSGSGSGFFVSRLGHVVTNAHVVKDCKRVTVGDNANSQTRAEPINSDRKSDLALLRVGSLETASAETKSLVSELGLKVVPLAGDGLLRSEDVRLGETVLVAGFPYGDIFSSAIKVTGGMVSSVRGLGDDSGQFQMDAAVQSGSSGGPIYDKHGSIVGVVVAQLNKLKVAKAIGSFPENVNFGIKASTVRQFLTSSGLPSKWSTRSKKMDNEQIASIAEKQTLMVLCHR